jgi:glycosyltransferase involved in cell wall biosynthesis
MSAGVPVVASARGSLPEVVGDAGLLVDPENTAALTDAIERIISDDTLRKNLSYRGTQQAARFSWSRTATDIRQAYQDALLARRDRQARPAHANRH